MDVTFHTPAGNTMGGSQKTSVKLGVHAKDENCEGQKLGNYLPGVVALAFHPGTQGSDLYSLNNKFQSVKDT